MDGSPQCMRRCRSHKHAAAVIAAILRGSEEEAVAYMNWMCSNCAQVTDVCGRTALHIAASKGRRRVAEWLVKQRDAILNVRDHESGYTALHRSIFYGQIHVAVSLIQLGGNVSALDKEDLTPIQHAMKSRPPIVEYSKNGPCEAYVWGSNANFNLGLGNQQSRKAPELMDFFRRSSINIKQVALSMFHSVFVSDTGRVFSCGHGQGGRLGQDSEKPSLMPQLMKTPAAEVCVQASISTDHTVLLMENGTVWTCGSNKYHQLGHNPTVKMLCSPRPLSQHSLPSGKVLGVCTGRYHTVIWSKDGLRTCGLNAGQLGHPKGEATYPIPKQVQALQQPDCHITHVASSDAATVLVMKKGTIVVLHEHRCRTIASRMLHVKQIAVCGGRLDSDVEQSSEELKVCVLTTTGQLMLWQQSSQQLTKCMLQLKRLLIVTDVTMTNQQLLFCTQDGETFEGFIQSHKKSDGHIKGSCDGTEEWEYIRVRCLPNVHRAVSVSCDPKGRNFAVLQSHPKTALLELPQMESSNMREQMQTLLHEACEEDAIHDVVFLVGGRRFAAHACIIASHSEVMSQLIAESRTAENEEEAPIVKLNNIKPDIFEQFLQFIYTNQCDLLKPGPCQIKFCKETSDTSVKKKKMKTAKVEDDELICNPETTSAFQVFQAGGHKGKKWKGESGTIGKSNATRDPMREIAAIARKLGLQSLNKALDTVQYREGEIKQRGNHNTYVPTPVVFDRTKLQSLCDVTVKSLDGKEMQAHRSILAARLEYFYSMFAHGWAEAGRNTTMNMTLPATVLEVLLSFLYTDEAPQVADDPELARTMLVVADQMFIDRLKEACECALASTLTLRNAAELLQLAATYNAEQLKLSCMQYISINLSAFLETRSLEEVEWPVLEDLAKYYRELTPAMWTRTITPYSEPPTSAELESVAVSFPVNLEQEYDTDDFKELLDSKKAKPKKQRKIRRVSSNENWRVRKESISSNASDGSEDHSDHVLLHAPLIETKEEITRIEVNATPITPPVLLNRVNVATVTTPAVQTQVNTVPVVLQQVNTAVITSAAELEEKRKKWNSMFPDLSASVDFVESRSQKISERKPITKMSQKEKKRLLAEQSHNSSTPPSPRSAAAWGLQQLQITNVRETSPLHDIMKEEKSRGNAWNTSNAIPIPVATPSVASPQSPPESVWKFPPSPVSSACSSTPVTGNLDAIVADELQQRKNLQRVRAKSLYLTQIEDKAIEELLSFYNAHNCTEERITVQRVETGVVATPTWVSSHR